MSNTEKNTYDYNLRSTLNDMDAGDGNDDDQPSGVEPTFDLKVKHIIEMFIKSTINGEHGQALKCVGIKYCDDYVMTDPDETEYVNYTQSMDKIRHHRL